MKTRTRGLGFVYQPGYRDKKTGEMRAAANFWISYQNHGRQIRENAHTTSRSAAMQLLKAKIGDVGAGKPVGPQLERTTIGDLIDLVVQDYRTNGRRSGERVLHASKHLKEHFGSDCKSRAITTDALRAYKVKRLDDGAKPSTINYELAVLRRGFRLGRNMVPTRPDFELLHVDNARKGFFEREQYESVLRHLPSYLVPVARVAYITGWRVRSELLTRQWRHIDFDAGWLRLDTGETKNGEGREFPFTPELKAVLEEQRDRVRGIQRELGQVIPWVFVHGVGEGRAAAGSPIKNFRTAWSNACRDAGVPGRLVHDFRRTAVRNLERAGVSRSAAMKMTGHKTEAVYRRYAIVDSAMLQEAAAKLAALHAGEAKYQRSIKVETNR